MSLARPERISIPPVRLGRVTRGTLISRLALLSGFCLAAAPLVAQEPTAPSVWPGGYREDANLFDLCFVSSQLGWAVGDRGTILHTQDGGQTWQLQPCPVRGRLEAVHFINAQQGWAVGGQTRPYTHRSQGFVLRTEDGGQTWKTTPQQFLPWLTGVRFSDAEQGVCYGLPSAMFPSAAYRTRDGGLHWTPLPGTSRGWVDGLIDARGQGMLIERSGQLARAEADGLVPSGKLKQETRLPQRMADDEQGRWWLCGNQGLIQVSEDQGQHWLAPRGLPAALLMSEFDWQAVAARGEDVWIVGVPGSRILVTHDGGQSWHMVDTGQALPLYAVEFVDSQHGWAVGALGTVLVTQDGGRSWSHQRGAQYHLAVLGVFGQIEQVPWEAVAQLAAGEGYWTRLEVLAESAGLAAQAGKTPISTRLHEATVMLGGAGANLIQSLPAPDPRLKLPADLLRRRWDQVTRSHSSHQLTEYLVRQIRTWQPDLVIVAEPRTASDGLNDLTRQLVLQATEQAADANSFPTQLEAGMKTWRVSRVTTLKSEVGGSGYPINGSQLVLSLGQTVAHLANRARANLSDTYRPGADRLVLRTLDGDTPARRGLFATRAESSGAISRRASGALADDVRQRSQQAQRRRNLEVLLSGTKPGDTAVWQQAMHLAAELSAEDRGELFLATAEDSLRRGNPSIAFELLNQLQRDPASQPLAEAARVRLLWYLASEEAMLHWPLPNLVAVQQVTQAGALGAESGPVRPVTYAAGGETQPLPVETATLATPLEGTETRRIESAKRLVEAIQAQQPDLYFEPLVRFPLAALQRRTSDAEAAAKFWRSQLAGRIDPAYRSWAASELALMESGSLPARASWNCPLLRDPPHLDGQLDDPAWQTVAATPLQAPAPADSAHSATRVRLAYDPEFLYIAVQAEKIPALPYSSSEQTRRRDEVLEGDRVEIYLDVDRDGATYWALTIDYRGGAEERLNDDRSWNPQWYIATATNESSWTIEAAIPLAELTTQTVRPGVSWCIGMQRIMPGHGWETWLQPAPIEARPEEFGLLRFQ